MYVNYFSRLNELLNLQRWEVIEEFDLLSTTQLGNRKSRARKTLRWKNLDGLEDSETGGRSERLGKTRKAGRVHPPGHGQEAGESSKAPGSRRLPGKCSVQIFQSVSTSLSHIT